jgi:ribosome recycling factor
MATLNADNLTPTTKHKMDDAIEAMNRDFAAVRTGKASPSLVENVTVDYYGTATRLRDIAGITAPEPRLLVVQPWDQSAVKSIEKAIIASEIGISPVSDGRVIRLPIPELSEERRQELVKMVRSRGEQARVEVRNLRREANDTAKELEKKSDITEDDLHTLTKQIQDLTDQHVKQIDDRVDAKEKELMEV